jgi:hypothetical protein
MPPRKSTESRKSDASTARFALKEGAIPQHIAPAPPPSSSSSLPAASLPTANQTQDAPDVTEKKGDKDQEKDKEAKEKEKEKDKDKDKDPKGEHKDATTIEVYAGFLHLMSLQPLQAPIFTSTDIPTLGTYSPQVHHHKAGQGCVAPKHTDPGQCHSRLEQKHYCFHQLPRHVVSLTPTGGTIDTELVLLTLQTTVPMNTRSMPERRLYYQMMSSRPSRIPSSVSSRSG